MHGAEGGSRLGHVKSDAQRGLHHAARRTVGTLPKRRKPEGRSRSGDRGELPHAATEEFAKSYQINLRLLPELAFSFEHDENFFAPTPPPLGTDPAKPLILLAQIAICPESRPQLPRLRPPGRNPPPPAAFDTPARLSAPLRALPRLFARVVLALRATRPLSMPWLLRQLVRSPTARLRRKLGERPTRAVRHRKESPTRCLSSPTVWRLVHD